MPVGKFLYLASLSTFFIGYSCSTKRVVAEREHHVKKRVVATSEGEVRTETVLVEARNNYSSRPYYEMIAEESLDNGLRSLHFDSQDRETWEFIERVASFDITDFRKEKKHRHTGMVVFKIRPHGEFNNVTGGFFTFKYRRKFVPLFGGFGEVDLGIIRQYGDWVLVDENEERVVDMYFCKGKLGIADVVLGYGGDIRYETKEEEEEAKCGHLRRDRQPKERMAN